MTEDNSILNGGYCTACPDFSSRNLRYAKPVGSIGTSNRLALNEQLTQVRIINQVEQKINGNYLYPFLKYF